MNKEKLLKVLKYAKTAVTHPEAWRFNPPVYTDGVVLGYPPSSESLKEQFNKRISKIEEYEQFQKDVDELIRQNEI